MEFRSVQQINTAVVRLLPELAGRFDRLVGMSDGAMVAARILAQHLRLPVSQIDLKSLEQKTDHNATARTLFIELVVEQEAYAKRLREAIAGRDQDTAICLAVYAINEAESQIDFVGECVGAVPYFEWNFLERDGLERVCFDIDGVLCEDPSEDQNDDGPIYTAFLSEARPLHLPSTPVGWLVTSRLEKYRQQTIDWMDKVGVRYNELHMIDLPNKEARQAAKCHGTFKAQVYGSVDADLFIESNPRQAWEIAVTTQKPVFCVDTMQMIDLEDRSMAYPLPKPVGFSDKLKRKLRGAAKRVLR